MSDPSQTPHSDEHRPQDFRQPSPPPPPPAAQAAPVAAAEPAPAYPAPGSPASGYPAQGYPAPGHPAPASPATGYPAPGYPAPGAAAPGHPAPGYPAPGQPVPGYPAPVYAQPAPPRGLLPWVLGFLILIPFPFLGGFASGIAMSTSGGSSRRFGGPARENARAALNWGLTYLLVSTVLFVSHWVILGTLTAESPNTGFFPIGIPITLYLAVSVAHLVVVIIGTVRVSSGKVMRVPFAIPFLRA